MIYFLIHYLYIVSLLAVDVGNDKVECCTCCYKVGNLLTFQHLIHCAHQGQAHRTELQAVWTLVAS